MGHLPHPHAGEAELPDVAARAAVGNVAVAQPGRAGVAGKSSRRRSANRADLLAAFDDVLLTADEHARGLHPWLGADDVLAPWLGDRAA